MLLEQVRAFCQANALFTSGTTVVVAVSGGADSLALLHLLLDLRLELGIELMVATLDHNIRGEASAADAEFVGEIAKAWDVPIVSAFINVPGLAYKRRMGLEMAARLARYTFLADVARRLGARAIATGHNQDDQAETVLMHVIRGSGLGGLRGMSARTPLREVIAGLADYPDCEVVRPLLNTPRAEIDQFVRELGITPRADATNEDTHYTRNRLRHEILPILKAINPQVLAALSRTAQIAQDDYQSLQTALPALVEQNKRLWVDRTAYASLSVGQHRSLIRLAVQRLAPGQDLDFEAINRASHFAREKMGRIRVAGAIWLQAERKRVAFYHLDYPADSPYMERGTSIPAFEAGPRKVVLPGDTWAIILEAASEVSRSLPALAVEINVPRNAKIEVRTRRAGDRFRPEGSSGHSQKLSDTLINMKIPAQWRDHVPLVIVDGEIACFCAPLLDGPRLRRAEAVAPTPDEPSDKPEAEERESLVIQFCPIPD